MVPTVLRHCVTSLLFTLRFEYYFILLLCLGIRLSVRLVMPSLSRPTSSSSASPSPLPMRPSSSYSSSSLSSSSGSSTTDSLSVDAADVPHQVKVVRGDDPKCCRPVELPQASQLWSGVCLG